METCALGVAEVASLGSLVHQSASSCRHHTGTFRTQHSLLRPRHADSKRGSEILADWSSAVGKFWQLVPPSEEGTPEASPAAESLSSADIPSAVPMAA